MPVFQDREPARSRQGSFVDNSADSPPPAFPATSYDAYVAGMSACRAGTDLAVVVHEAVLKWPLSDHHRWCELVASASLGYWTEGGRR